MSSRVGVLLRGATTTPGLSVFLVVVIAALSFVGVAAPALIVEGRTATVQRAIQTLPDGSRWPSATAPGLPAIDGNADGAAGIWTSSLDLLDAERRAQPQPLRSMLGAPRLITRLDPVTTIDDDPDRVTPVPNNRVGITSDPGFAERSDLVEGRLPRATDPAEGIEIALTTSIAEQLAWSVGEDRAWDGTRLLLTGIVTPSERDAADWSFVSGSIDPLVEVTPSGDRVLIATAFMHVDQPAALVDRVTEFKTTAWFPFDAEGVDAANAERTAAQLRLLAADPIDLPMFADTFFNRGLAFTSVVPRAIDTGLARADAMTTVVAVAAIGPIAVAVVVLALVGRLIVVRRVSAARVLRARGASTGRLVALFGGEGGVLGVIGAALGAAVGAMTVGWAGPTVVVVPLALAAVPAVVLPRGALTDARRRGRSDLGGPRSRGMLRALGEAVLFVVTALLSALVITRGGIGSADPLLLVLPVLLGACGSILALRLLPPLLRAAERRGRGGASLVALLGPARALRDPVVRVAPVLAVVVGLGVAVFSVAFAATVSSGIVRAASITVGADVRIDGAYVDEAAADRVAALDGVETVAALRGDFSVEATAGSQRARAHVYTVDRDEFTAVQRDSAAALPLPEQLAAAAADGVVPVVASDALLERLDAIDPAEQQIEIDGAPVRIVGTAPSQVPFGAAEQWVIVDPANAAALGQRGSGMSQLYLAIAPGADPDAVGAAAVRELGGAAVFETPAAIAAGYAADPAFRIVQGALLAASGIVAVLLAVAVVATLMLGTPARVRMLAVLRTLGHPSRGARRLVAWEVSPALLLALPFGVGVGVAMAWLVIPRLDLRGFVGGSDQPPVVLGGVWPVLVMVGFGVVVAAAVAAAAALASRLGAAAVIDAGEERE